MHRLEIRDVNGNGWDIIKRWQAVSRPSGIDGDFSYNGELDLHDLSILTQNVAVGATNLKLDMNGDETVDVGDIYYWVTNLKSTTMGDADLDGEVNFADFLTLSNNFGEAGGWKHGDFDTNEKVDFADFLILSANFSSTSPTAAAVPEPTGAYLALFGFLGLIGFRKRR